MPSHRSHISKFLEHEHHQGRLLREALRQNRGQFYRGARRELRRVSKKQARALYAHNPYARALLFEHLSKMVHAAVGARLPSWLPDRPVYFITIIDRRQIVPPFGKIMATGYAKEPTITAIGASYRKHLLGIDYVGMIDFAYYISARNSLPDNYIGVPHIHAIAWNIDENTLESYARAARAKIRPIFTYATAFHFRKIDPKTFARVLWYVCKSPRSQFQLHKKSNGRTKQYSSDIVPRNRLRFLNIMHSHSLLNYVQAGGEGIEVVRHAVAKIRDLPIEYPEIRAKRDPFSDPWPNDEDPMLGRNRWGPWD